MDTGNETSASRDLIPFLDNQGIKHIDQMVISHGHADNYGGAPALLAHFEGIEEVVFNQPDKDACENDSADLPCQWQDLQSLMSGLASAGIEARGARVGDVLYEDQERDIALLVLHPHDGRSSTPGPIGLNETALVLLLQYGDQRILFTSDLGPGAAHDLLQRGIKVRANLSTAPHHGADNAAGNRFFNAVNPEAVMVSASAPVWHSPAARRMRSYFTAKGIPAYVSGLHGNVRIEIKPGHYKILPEIIPAEEPETKQ